MFEYSKTTHVDTVVEQQEGGAQGEQATTTNCQATTSGMGQSARFYAELTWVKITEMKSFPQARFSADGSSGFSLSLQVSLQFPRLQVSMSSSGSTRLNELNASPLPQVWAKIQPVQA